MVLQRYHALLPLHHVAISFHADNPVVRGLVVITSVNATGNGAALEALDAWKRLVLNDTTKRATDIGTRPVMLLRHTRNGGNIAPIPRVSSIGHPKGNSGNNNRRKNASKFHLNIPLTLK